MGLLLLALAAGVSYVVLETGRAQLRLQSAEDVLDAVVLSALRIKTQGLQRLAAQWEENLGKNFGEADNEFVMLTSSSLESLKEEAGSLRRTLSGYQGRVTSVLRVSAEANGWKKDALDIPDPDAFRLGVEPAPARIRTIDGHVGWVDSVWFRRTWRSAERTPRTSGRAVLQTGFARPRPFVLRAAGRIRWDVPGDDASRRGLFNGGYPRRWEEAVYNGALNPYRIPLFRAEADNGSE